MNLLARTVKDHRDLLAQAGMGDDVPTSGLFTSAGQVFYRSGWGPDDLWWAFDAAGWGGAHSHLSRLSVELHNAGRTTLPDPGIFDYEMTNPLGPAGKSTPMHSTMNVDLCNQVDLDARLMVMLNHPQALVVHGRYEGGYWPGTFGWTFVARGPGRFGVHDRTLIWLKDRAMIVLDRLLHEASTPAYLHWVSDDVPIELDEQALRMKTADPKGNVWIGVCPLCEAEVSACIRRGEKDPYLGWIGALDDASPAPLFQCRFRALRPKRATVATECISVIVPFAGPETPALEVSARRIDATKREVVIEWAHRPTDRVVYTAAGSSDYGSSRPTGQVMTASVTSSRGDPWATVCW